MNLKKLLIIAVLLRLLVSGLLFHPDIKTIAFQTSFLKTGVTDIYTYLTNNKATLPLKEEFVYFPLTYFTLGGYQAIVSPLLGNGFDKWLADGSANSVVNNPNIFKYLIALKLPLILVDIAIAYLLLGFFVDRKKGELAFELWLFNPFTIILIYAFSNIDLYAVLLTLIAFLLIKQEKIIKASAVLGLAIAFKLYPLLFVPFLIVKGKNTKEKILAALIPISIFVATLLPFWSTNFVNSALLSGLSTRIFSPNFVIGFGESMIVGLMLLSIMFGYAWINEKSINLFNYFVVLLLTLFSFSHFHISWLLWIAPFLVILVIERPKLALPVFLWSTLAISIPFLYNDRSMTISLFRIYTSWFDLLPIPFTIVQKFYDPFGLQSMIHSLLAGISVVLSYNIFKPNKDA
jgi:hypothetical protein